MSDLQKLRESVLAKAHKEGQALLEQAKEKHEREYLEKLQQMTREKESQRKLQLNKEDQRLSRLEQQIANQERQENLKSRQMLIDELFDGAVKQMTDWNSDQFLHFAKRILNQFADKEIQLTFGEITKSKLSFEQFQELYQSFPKLTIDESSITQSAGFILKEGRVDYNFLFEQLVSSLRDEMSAELAKQVFNVN